jgi:hypothetical protein
VSVFHGVLKKKKLSKVFFRKNGLSGGFNDGLYQSCLTSNVMSWIVFVSRKKVEEVKFTLFSSAFDLSSVFVCVL